MRSISETNNSLLDKLNQKRSTIEFFGRKDSKKDILIEIMGVGEPAVIPYLLDHLFSRDWNTANKTAEVIDNLLKNLSARDFIWFEKYFRMKTIGWSFLDSRWDKIDISDLKIVHKFPGYQVAVLGLLSFHINGYVREEAVKRLRLVNDGSELPYLLLRLNDWVDPVRKEAFKSMEEKVTEGNTLFFLRNLSLVKSLEYFERYDHSFIIGSVHDLIREAGINNEFRTIILSGDSLFRREVFKILLKNEGKSLSEIIELGIYDSDLIVRNLIIRSLNRLDNEDKIEKNLGILEKDNFYQNRKNVLEIYVTLFPERSYEKLYNALFDPNPSIRYDARYYLKKNGEYSFSEIYKEALKAQDKSNLPGIIGGLGETGDKNDALLLLEFLESRYPKLRRHAIKAIVTLSGEEFKNRFSDLIFDKSPKVSKEALSALMKCRFQTEISRLVNDLDGTCEKHIFDNVLSLISNLSKWDSLEYLIETLGFKRAESNDRIMFCLNRWISCFNMSFDTPMKEKKDKIIYLLEKNRKEIGEVLFEKINYYLKSS